MPTTVTNRFLRKQMDNLEKKEETANLYEELKYSSLIIPVNGNEYERVNVDGRELIPLSTDIHEYRKLNLDDDFLPKACHFNFYLELLQRGCPGFIVNPESEGFIITSDILEVMDTDYMFDLDYQPITFSHIREIYDSMDNREISEFITSDGRDLYGLMEILLSSDLLSLICTEEPLEDIDGTGIMDCSARTSYCCMENYALLFSKHCVGQGHENSYSQLVNLHLFIDEALKNDLSGIILDNSIVLSRDFLIDFMKSFNCPCIDDYTFFAFSWGDDGQ